MDVYCLLDSRVQLGIGLTIMTSLLVYKSLRRKKNLPPGPMPLPIIGNLWNIGRKDFYLKITSLKEKYGPLLTVYLGPEPIVFLNTAEVAKEAFLNHADEFAGRDKPHTMSNLSDGIIFGQFGPLWKLQRKVVHSALRKYASGHHLEEMVHKSFDEVVKLIPENKPVFPGEYNLDLIYNMISGVCFGKQFHKTDDFFLCMKEFLTTAPKRFGNGFLADLHWIFQNKIFETENLRTWRRYVQYLKKEIEKRFDDHLESYDEDNLTDFMYDLIHLWEKAKVEEPKETVLSQLTKQHFINVILDMFLAGVDSTRVTLTFVMAYMANYPEIQEKVHQEIVQVYGTEGYVTLDAKDRLPFTMAAIFECMRIMPIAPLGVPHKTICDTKLGEFIIPKDTKVMMNVWAIHHDPDVFEDPWEYKPERWLDADGQFKYHPYTFLPFSMGRRVCVGEAFAKSELPMIVACFLQKFKIERSSKDLISIVGIEFLLLLDAKPYNVLFTPRN